MHAHGLLFLISFAKKRPALSVLRGTQTRARARSCMCKSHHLRRNLYADPKRRYQNYVRCATMQKSEVSNVTVTIRPVFPGHVLFLRHNNGLLSSGCIERRNCPCFWSSIFPQKKISSNSDLLLLISKEDVSFPGTWRLEFSLKYTPAPNVIISCQFTFYSFFPVLL